MKLYIIQVNLQDLVRNNDFQHNPVALLPRQIFFLSLNEVKKVWLASSTGILVNALHKLITVKN